MPKINYKKIIEGNDLLKKRQILYEIEVKSRKEYFHDIVNQIQVEKNVQLKEIMLIVINKMYLDKDLELVINMLKSEDAYTRNGAIEIIDNHKVKNYKYIKKIIQNENKDVRKFILDLLRNNDSSEALEIVLDRLKNDEDINVRIDAVEILGENLKEESVQDIEWILLNENNFMLLCTAFEALWKIGKSPQYERILKKHYHNYSNPIILHSIIKYISILEDNIIFRIIETVLRDYNKKYIKEIISVLQKMEKEPPDYIMNFLKDIVEELEHEREKYELLKLIYGQGDAEKCRNKAINMLNSKEEMVILAGMEILSKFGKIEDVEILKKLSNKLNNNDMLEVIKDTVTSLTKIKS